MMPDLIAERYPDCDLQNYHPGLISYDKVAQVISEDLEISLDLGKHEMGYVVVSPAPGLPSMSKARAFAA